MTDTAETDSDVSDEYAYTKLTTKIKRGTGTRDQDTTKVVTRHPDPSTAVSRHMTAVAAFQELTDTVRRIHPEVDDE
jgi:hypothetical protein